MCDVYFTLTAICCPASSKLQNCLWCPNLKSILCMLALDNPGFGQPAKEKQCFFPKESSDGSVKISPWLFMVWDECFVFLSVLWHCWLYDRKGRTDGGRNLASLFHSWIETHTFHKPFHLLTAFFPQDCLYGLEIRSRLRVSVTHWSEKYVFDYKKYFCNLRS